MNILLLFCPASPLYRVPPVTKKGPARRIEAEAPLLSEEGSKQGQEQGALQSQPRCGLSGQGAAFCQEVMAASQTALDGNSAAF